MPTCQRIRSCVCSYSWWQCVNSSGSSSSFYDVLYNFTTCRLYLLLLLAKTFSNCCCRRVIFAMSGLYVFTTRSTMSGHWEWYHCLTQWTVMTCGLRGCKNRPAPFPGRMSYKATKPGSVCLSYLSMLYYYCYICGLLKPLFMYY